MPSRDNETGLSTAQYPGVRDARGRLVSTYTEGPLIGYKWYDAHGVAPRFPFGHGLSFATFGYSARAPIVRGTAALGAGVDVDFVLTNLGARDGPAGAQCYT